MPPSVLVRSAPWRTSSTALAFQHCTIHPGPVGEELSVESIVDDTIAQVDIADIGDEWFLQPLAAWSDDLGSDNLTVSGRRFLRRLAVNDVARRCGHYCDGS